MIKEALVEMDEKIEGMDAWLVNTVHDEISVIGHKDVAEEVDQILDITMVETANRYLNGVVMKSDGKIANFWIH